MVFATPSASRSPEPRAIERALALDGARLAIEPLSVDFSVKPVAAKKNKIKKLNIERYVWSHRANHADELPLPRRFPAASVRLPMQAVVLSRDGVNG